MAHVPEPSAGGEKGRGVVGAKGRDGRAVGAGGLVAATEERRAREVECHGRAVVRDAHGDRHVRIDGVYLGLGSSL